MQKSPTRRSVTAGLALGALAVPGLRIGLARAQAKSIKMAMIAPLSGPWARQGQLLRQGAEMAIDEINQKGGIEKLGGAKFELVVADDKLDLEVSRRIMDFHRLRKIQVRHGLRIVTERQIYFRWCFSDLGRAEAFIEQFGGEVLLPEKPRRRAR